MSDFWHEDVPLQWLDEALDVIDRTPKLTYQILTKRPGMIKRRLDSLKRLLPGNVWIGATVGHQRSLSLLKPLRAVDAKLRFLSCEPLLTALPGLSLDGIGWLNAGGQSGREAAPSHPDWFRELRDLCVDDGVPFHFKQWGEWWEFPTGSGFAEEVEVGSEMADSILPLTTRPGWIAHDGRFFGSQDDLPDDETPCRLVDRVGKHRAGATLDGREWKEFPR
jgi:protein gp37